MRHTTVDIALPVLNEEQSLDANVRALFEELTARCAYNWSLTIVDNGSTDDSWEVARKLADTEPRIRALRLGERGRGGALKAAWTSSEADILAYMDIDLSTDLAALVPLLDPIAASLADISIGSRLDRSSQVTRGVRREAISHVYNWIARAVLRYGVRDAQCGFKAVTRQVAQSIVPLVEDDSWFFDTELLVLAWRRGMRIEEIPVRWIEDDDSRVRIMHTAIDDLRGIWRLARDRGDRPTAGDGAPITARVLESIPCGTAAEAVQRSSDPAGDGP